MVFYFISVSESSFSPLSSSSFRFLVFLLYPPGSPGPSPSSPLPHRPCVRLNCECRAFLDFYLNVICILPARSLPSTPFHPLPSLPLLFLSLFQRARSLRNQHCTPLFVHFLIFRLRIDVNKWENRIDSCSICIYGIILGYELLCVCV